MENRNVVERIIDVAVRLGRESDEFLTQQNQSRAKHLQET